MSIARRSTGMSTIALMLVTALAPRVGYYKAAKIAHTPTSREAACLKQR